MLNRKDEFHTYFNCNFKILKMEIYEEKFQTLEKVHALDSCLNLSKLASYAQIIFCACMLYGPHRKSDLFIYGYSQS